MAAERRAAAAERVQAVLDELQKLEELLGPLAAAAQQGKSTQVTRSNISNN